MKILNVFLVLALLLVYACSSNDSANNENDDRFPFVANIEYRVSSSVNAALGDIYFVNENKQEVSLTDESLPYSNSFDVQVEFGDTFFINTISSSNNLKVALYIDGVLIREVEGSEAISNSLSIVHQFGLVDVTSRER